ncbi:hypothetical protein BAT_3665 [Bacillus pumilus ATCC 7061]|nr:hypothetical protein BAT_3665 [Bacillus pumilus ATCC 7061]
MLITPLFVCVLSNNRFEKVSNLSKPIQCSIRMMEKDCV